MRTTIDVDDAVLEAARGVARQTRRTIGAVISEWARRGSASPPFRTSKRSRVPTFDVPADAEPMDPARVKELLDDEGLPP